jgi:hypothetical protein
MCHISALLLSLMLVVILRFVLVDVTDRMLSEGWPSRGLVVVVVEKGIIQSV